MNFLAHMILSGNSDEIKLGNFMGDYVKGRDYQNYPPLIQKGIILHRHIDSFTDNHSIVHRDKIYFAERYQKYAGVVTDILYDHFLATEWTAFTNANMDEYVEHIHHLLTDNIEKLPEGLQRLVPFIIKNRWFKSYLTLDGVRSVLIGMAKNTSLPDESTFAIKVIEKNYGALRQDFLDFFPLIIEEMNKELNELS